MSNDAKTFNGWTNYETWCAYLWLTNEEPTYLYWREQAKRFRDEAPQELIVQWEIMDARRNACLSLADAMKGHFETFHPFRGEHLETPREPDIFCDLLDAAISEVNWGELAEMFLEELEPENEPDPEGEESHETEEEPADSEAPKQEEAGGPKGPRFELGRVVSTPGALAAIEREDIAKALTRHHQGDWGDVGPVDWQMNEAALEEGERLFSVYYGIDGVKFWVITEADRSATTILLPDEY